MSRLRGLDSMSESESEAGAPASTDTFFDSLFDSPQISRPHRAGDTVEALCADDNEWYLARIESAQNRLFRVYFLELGIVQDTRPDNIRAIGEIEPYEEAFLAPTPFNVDRLSSADWALLADNLVENVPTRDISVAGKRFPGVFEGSRAVSWLLTETDVAPGIETRSQATSVFAKLVAEKRAERLNSASSHFADSAALFRLVSEKAKVEVRQEEEKPRQRPPQSPRRQVRRETWAEVEAFLEDERRSGDRGMQSLPEEEEEIGETGETGEFWASMGRQVNHRRATLRQHVVHQRSNEMSNTQLDTEVSQLLAGLQLSAVPIRSARPAPPTTAPRPPPRPTAAVKQNQTTEAAYMGVAIIGERFQAVRAEQLSVEPNERVLVLARPTRQWLVVSKGPLVGSIPVASIKFFTPHRRSRGPVRDKAKAPQLRASAIPPGRRF